MRMQVLLGWQVLQSNRLATGNWLPKGIEVVINIRGSVVTKST